MCGWSKQALYCCKRWNLRSIRNRRLILIPSQRPQSVLLIKFWYFTSSTECTYFYKFLTGKNFVQWFLILWWAFRFPVKSLWRIFIFVLILKQHENCVLSTSDSWWYCFIVVEIIHYSMNECFLIDGQRNGHSIWACCAGYSFHKTKINPLKLIVTDAQTNFVYDLHHQPFPRAIMKQYSQWNTWNGLCFFRLFIT